MSYESLESIEGDLDEMKSRQDAKLCDLDALNDVYCELARYGKFRINEHELPEPEQSKFKGLTILELAL